MVAYRFLCCVLCLLLAFCSGCTTLSVGNVSSSKDNLSVQVDNPGAPVEAGVQVRVYKIQGMTQEELIVTGVPATLKKGENTVTVPLHLDPGTYKIYIYVTINNERQTASIKDLVI